MARHVTNPCDVLINPTPTEETAKYIIEKDRPFAQQVAQIRGRYETFGCTK